MGKLNILHHKDWHVWKRENLERVRKDEKKAAKEAEIVESDAARLERERRLDKLQKFKPEKHIDLIEPVLKNDEYEQELKEQAKYVKRFTTTFMEKQQQEPWYALKRPLSDETADASLKQLQDPLKIQERPVKKKKTASALSIEELRQQRLEREAKEREKSRKIIQKTFSKHETESGYYNSQFNPQLIKKKH